jgi:Dolichyl-phosphate-mannose-protein mannosyltransferase
MNSIKNLKLANAIRIEQLALLLPNLLVISCCLMSIGLSVLESKINIDAHHWGLMYANATDLHKGLTPYREIFIQYGLLTTFIQSLSLDIFGDAVVSVGYITGIFYAANIYLSYCLWRRIFDKWLSALSALLMFLLQSYISFPWANYFSYTFLLISLLFLTASTQKKNRYLLTGVFIGLSFLARQSPIPLLVPIYMYFCLIYVSSEQELRKLHLKNISMFHIGMFCIIGFFILYLVKESAFTDWIDQNFTIVKFYTYLVTPKRLILNFARGIIFPFGCDISGIGCEFGSESKRLFLYTLVFFNSLIFYLRRLKKLKGIQQQVNEKENISFLFSAVTIFGYINAAHYYNLFRLQNASSLGLGLLLFSLHNFSEKFNQWKKIFFGAPVIFVFTLLVFFTNSDLNIRLKPLLTHQLKEPENIEMLHGKLYNQKSRDQYQTLTKILDSYGCQLEFLVNLTVESYIPSLSKSFKKVQRSPFYNEEMSNIIFRDEKNKIDQLLTEEKAILIVEKAQKIPGNYKVIFKNIYSIDYYTRDVYVAVPKSATAICPLK